MNTNTTTSGEIEQKPVVLELEKKTGPIIKIFTSNTSSTTTTFTTTTTTTTTCNTSSAKFVKIIRTTTAPICSTTISPALHSKTSITVHVNKKSNPPLQTPSIVSPLLTPTAARALLLKAESAIPLPLTSISKPIISNQTPSIDPVPSTSHQTSSTLLTSNTNAVPKKPPRGSFIPPLSSDELMKAKKYCFCCSEDFEIKKRRVKMNRVLQRAPFQGKTIREAFEGLFLMGQPLFNDPDEEEFRYICMRCLNLINTLIPRYYDSFSTTSLLGERIADFKTRFEALLLMGKEIGHDLRKKTSTTFKPAPIIPRLTHKILKESEKSQKTRKMLKSFVGRRLNLEAKQLTKSQFLRSDVMNQDENNNVFDKISEEIARKAPNIAYYMSKIVNEDYEYGHKLDNTVLAALCILLHKRNKFCNKFQKLFSLAIIRNTGNKRVFRILNRLNLSISKKSLEEVVRKLESSNPGFYLSKWLNENNFQFSLTGEKGQTVSNHNPSIQIAVVEKVRINDEPLVEVSSGTPTNNDWSSHVSGEMMNMSFLNGEDDDEDDDEEEILPDINDIEEDDILSDSPPPTPPSPRKSPRKRKATPKARANALKSMKHY